MNEQDLLIDWIHKSEWDFKENNVSTRIPSLVTDLHFERTLTCRSELDICTPLTFGWTVCSAGAEARHWYKVSEGTLASKDTDKAFIKAVSKVDQTARFFVLEHEVKFSPDGIPAIKFKVHQIGIEENSFKIKKDEGEFLGGEQLDRRILQQLKMRKGCQHNGEITPWLRQLDISSLQRILVTRCFMNFSGCRLTDIDAIGMNRLGKLEMFEFKRKYPASGHRSYQLLTVEDVTNPLPSYHKKIKSFVGKKIFAVNEELADPLTWVNLPGDCFGLDTSHAKNFELCDKAKIDYRYIIWDTAKDQLNELLTDKLQAIGDQDIRVLNVKPSHVEKISFTFGRHSGTYTKDTRFQFMISKDKFTLINLKEDQQI